ncbi:MAG: helix-turn-helix transcriptional regulator [Bacilli bacterium]|nr:helix-turn-helix transcriptional regulator [Bacilli bacterium]
MEQENIQKFIKKLRKEKNLTQKQLADMLGVTYQAVSKWERGLNIPDISILKEISHIFDVDMDTMITGVEKKHKKYIPKFYFFLIFLLIFLLLFFIFLYFSNHNFYLKKVSSGCDDFIVNGSFAYNKEKSSLYISNIDYCGEENKTIYQEISWELYEEYQNNKRKIRDGSLSKNISLNDYLKKLEIHIDDYSSSCKKISSSQVYLEIKVKDKEGKVELYQVPIQLESDCEQ